MTALAERIRAVPSWQLTLGVALLALGFLIAAQLQSEGPRVRYSTQERPPLVETAQELQRTQEGLKARILELRAELARAQSAAAGNDRLVAELNDQLASARTAAGLLGLAGPGIVVQLADSPQAAPAEAAADHLVRAQDLRDVVSELWLAGAEAVSVNGERIVATTGFTDIGTSVLVNSAYLQAPYQISAIGPPGMRERLTASPGFLTFVQERVDPFGLDVGFAEPAEVLVPAYAGAVNLVETRSVPEPSPSVAP